ELAMSLSSKYANTTSSSATPLSTFRWNFAPDFMRPKGIRRYSKASNIVVIAVFCMSAGCTGN
ncbi:MAG: hypothetical protein ACK56F_27255, partial [bacterium]